MNIEDQRAVVAELKRQERLPRLEVSCPSCGGRLSIVNRVVNSTRESRAVLSCEDCGRHQLLLLRLMACPDPETERKSKQRARTRAK